MQNGLLTGVKYMFVDELKLYLKAGDGGDGVVRWLQEKGKDKMGPAGGNGGNGGSVYARGVRDPGLLFRYRHKKEFVAASGQDGMKKNMYGKNAPDLIVDFPVGTVITNLTDGSTYEILKEDQPILLLKGGRGGLGNKEFKSSVNRSPREFTEGKPGEDADFYIELRLIVDAGLVGLPNAGKSSLLNSITNSSAKVGGYEFTTLEPNLGSFYGYTIADIPGLIEGASQGKGLGYKFLRHIKRTKLIVHCISLENNSLTDTYNIIRKELESYDDELAKKEEIIILTKSDLVDKTTLDRGIKEMKKFNGNILTATVYDDKAVKKLADALVKILKKT